MKVEYESKNSPARNVLEGTDQETLVFKLEGCQGANGWSFCENLPSVWRC